MKQFFRAVLAAAKELTISARAWMVAGAAILAAFALVGMVKTAKFWLPMLAVALLLSAGWYAYRKYQEKIPPERRRGLINAVSVSVSYALHQETPYSFDRVTPEEVAADARIVRDSGADIVSVRLLLLEKHPENIDTGLLRQVFALRFAQFSKSPGLMNCAYSREFPLLTLAGAELIGQELTLHVLYTDSRAAVFYCKRLREEQREARKRAAQAHSPHMENTPTTLTEDDLL